MNLDEDFEFDYDFDELKKTLNKELEENLKDIALLENEKNIIHNPDRLGEVVKNVIWEQFNNQIGITAGQDFIDENHGMTLDLRKSSHIQTAKNFEQGKLATHNYISDETLEGKTSLMYACENQQKDKVIQMLIDNGADVNLTDKGGKSALLYALENYKKNECIYLLLKAEADINLVDANNEGVVDYIKKNPSLEKSDLLNSLDILASAKSSEAEPEAGDKQSETVSEEIKEDNNPVQE